VWGEGVVSPLGGVWRGNCALPNFFNFSFEMACFGASWAAFLSRDMLAGYNDYNTMFAGQAEKPKRK